MWPIINYKLKSQKKQNIDNTNAEISSLKISIINKRLEES